MLNLIPRFWHWMSMMLFYKKRAYLSDRKGVLNSE